MPRIPDDLLNVAFYLYQTEEAALQGEVGGGSGFVVSAWDQRDDNRGVMYAVTSGHVIGQAPFLRFNRKDGSPVILHFPEDRWHRSLSHDIAVASLSGVNTRELDLFLMPADLGYTRDRARYENIGVGDDVFIIGRFLGHDGKDRNLPTVRFGAISMMPIEKVVNNHTGLKEESFLVEVRSTAGYSGSPAFLYRGETLGQDTRLLGVVWGHFDHGAPDAKTNSGMAAVTPSWALLEILYEEDVVAERQRALGPDNPDDFRMGGDAVGLTSG
jgi:hypothetical protein